MNAPRRSPPAWLQRIRNWLRSDLRVLRWVLLAVYVAIVAGLYLYSWFHDGSDRLFLLILAGLVLGCQALFILGGGTMRLQRPIRKRRLWMPALAASLMFALLALGLALALSELFYLDDIFGQTSALLCWTFVAASWLFWFLVFFLGTRKWPRIKALNRMIAAVMAGSLIELIIAAVSHAIVSRRPGCLVGLATMLGILAGLQVLIVAFGPGIALLFLRQRHRREQQEDSPDARPPKFHFGLRMMFLVMLVFSLIFACIGFKVQKAKRNRYVEAQAKEVQAWIIKHGGAVQFTYDRHGDSLDDFFRDPGTLVGCNVDGMMKFSDAALQELGRLKTLRGLWLDGASVTDAGLVHLQNLPYLEHLDLTGTKITRVGLIHLSGLTRLKDLNLTCVQITNRELANLRAMTELQELQLHGTGVTDAGLVHLRELRNLRYLDLSRTAIQGTGFEILTQLARLRRLDLCRCHLTDVTGLQRVSQLEELWLDGCEGLTNVDGLHRLSRLRELHLSDCDRLTNVDGLRGLDRLNRLGLSNCASLSNLDGLRGMSSLEHLNLFNSESLKNVDGLEGLTGLTTLHLEGCESMMNVDGLRQATQLAELRLGGNTLLSNIAGLRGLPQLQQIDLSRCPLTDLGALQGLPKLQILNLADCHSLTDIDHLQSLPALHELTIDYSLVLDNLADLRRLTKLRTLHVSHGEGVPQEEKDKLKRQLPNLDIHFE